MMTNTIIFGSLVSMVTAQALVWCLTRCFSYFLQIMFTMVYAMNQNGWLALIICREKNLKTCTLQKQAFLANTQHQCLACCSKRIHQISIILVHCIECLSNFSLSLRKLEKLKAWKNRNVPIYLFHSEY